MIRNIKAGDVYLVDFKGEGHVMRGEHPAVVISCDKANFYSPNVIVVPLTSTIRKIYQPTHVVLEAAENGLRRKSMALCETPMTVPKAALQFYCTHLTDQAMKEISAAQLASFFSSYDAA